jgi:hypothetical protein
MDFILREADVMCVALRPANVGVLTRVQSALKAQGVSAEWTPRERLHCTLLTSDIPDDATAKAILRGLGLPLVFSTEGVRLEAWGDYLVLVLDPRPALPRIQTDIFNRAEALGLQVSSYAPPGVYRPHVTLGTFPRGSLDGLDGFPTDPLWFDEVVVWNGDYRQVDAARLPKEAGDRLFVEVSGMTRRLVTRGGPGSGHFGHEGRPGKVGGSQPGDFHEAARKKGGRSSDLHSATEALKVPRTEKWNPVRDALETIDSVHGIDSVPLNLKVTLLSPTSMNGGHLRVERGPGHFAIKNMALRILPEGETPDGIPQHLEFTVAHEFGHLLDWSAFREIQRSSGDWGDYDKPVQGSRAVWYLGAESKGMYGVMKAIKLSKAYDALKVDTMPYRAWPGSKVKLIYDRDTMRYLREPEELFARAYAQYVAVRSGDERMLKGVKDYQDGAKAGHPPMAWEDKDFQPIAAAFDSMFGERNWR